MLAVVLALYGRGLWQLRRQRAECAGLDASLQAAHALLRTLPDAIVATDRHGRVNYRNPRAAALAGVAEARALGQPLASLLNLQHDGAAIDWTALVLACLQPAAPDRAGDARLVR